MAVNPISQDQGIRVLEDNIVGLRPTHTLPGKSLNDRRSGDLVLVNEFFQVVSEQTAILSRLDILNDCVTAFIFGTVERDVVGNEEWNPDLFMLHSVGKGQQTGADVRNDFGGTKNA